MLPAGAKLTETGLQYTLFANSSRYGTPAINALWFEFPEEANLFGVDRQFLVGRDVLVTPVLEPNATTVDGVFPGTAAGTIWRDWYTQKAVNVSSGISTKLDAPLSHINVHIRSGSVILLHAEPGYTTKETRGGPYALLVSLDAEGNARGTAYIDDGISDPPGPSVDLIFVASGGSLSITATGTDGKDKYDITSRLQSMTVLGVQQSPAEVSIASEVLGKDAWTFQEDADRLVLANLTINLNQEQTFSWA